MSHGIRKISFLWSACLWLNSAILFFLLFAVGKSKVTSLKRPTTPLPGLPLTRKQSTDERESQSEGISEEQLTKQHNTDNGVTNTTVQRPLNRKARPKSANIDRSALLSFLPPRPRELPSQNHTSDSQTLQDHEERNGHSTQPDSTDLESLIRDQVNANAEHNLKILQQLQNIEDDSCLPVTPKANAKFIRQKQRRKSLPPVPGYLSAPSSPSPSREIPTYHMIQRPAAPSPTPLDLQSTPQSDPKKKVTESGQLQTFIKKIFDPIEHAIIDASPNSGIIPTSQKMEYKSSLIVSALCDFRVHIQEREGKSAKGCVSSNIWSFSGSIAA